MDFELLNDTSTLVRHFVPSPRERVERTKDLVDKTTTKSIIIRIHSWLTKLIYQEMLLLSVETHHGIEMNGDISLVIETHQNSESCDLLTPSSPILTPEKLLQCSWVPLHHPVSQAGKKKKNFFQDQTVSFKSSKYFYFSHLMIQVKYWD